MTDFYINLAAGLVGALILAIVQWLYKYIRERKSPYTGAWRGSIYDDEGQLVKRDIVRMRQYGDNIKGRISRTYPAELRHRKWSLNGKLRGRQMLGVFWSATQDIPSHGCWYLTQIDDDHFTGYYLSLHRRLSEEGGLVEIMEPVKVTLEREREHAHAE